MMLRLRTAMAVCALLWAAMQWQLPVAHALEYRWTGGGITGSVELKSNWERDDGVAVGNGEPDTTAVVVFPLVTCRTKPPTCCDQSDLWTVAALRVDTGCRLRMEGLTTGWFNVSRGPDASHTAVNFTGTLNGQPLRVRAGFSIPADLTLRIDSLSGVTVRGTSPAPLLPTLSEPTWAGTVEFGSTDSTTRFVLTSPRGIAPSAVLRTLSGSTPQHTLSLNVAADGPILFPGTIRIAAPLLLCSIGYGAFGAFTLGPTATLDVGANVVCNIAAAGTFVHHGNTRGAGTLQLTSAPSDSVRLGTFVGFSGALMAASGGQPLVTIALGASTALSTLRLGLFPGTQTLTVQGGGSAAAGCGLDMSTYDAQSTLRLEITNAACDLHVRGLGNLNADPLPLGGPLAPQAWTGAQLTLHNMALNADVQQVMLSGADVTLTDGAVLARIVHVAAGYNVVRLMNATYVHTVAFSMAAVESGTILFKGPPVGSTLTVRLPGGVSSGAYTTSHVVDAVRGTVLLDCLNSSPAYIQNVALNLTHPTAVVRARCNSYTRLQNTGAGVGNSGGLLHLQGTVLGALPGETGSFTADGAATFGAAGLVTGPLLFGIGLDVRGTGLQLLDSYAGAQPITFSGCVLNGGTPADIGTHVPHGPLDGAVTSLVGAVGAPSTAWRFASWSGTLLVVGTQHAAELTATVTGSRASLAVAAGGVVGGAFGSITLRDGALLYLNNTGVANGNPPIIPARLTVLSGNGTVVGVSGTVGTQGLLAFGAGSTVVLRGTWTLGDNAQLQLAHGTVGGGTVFVRAGSGAVVMGPGNGQVTTFLSEAGAVAATATIVSGMAQWTGTVVVRGTSGGGGSPVTFTALAASSQTPAAVLVVSGINPQAILLAPHGFVGQLNGTDLDPQNSGAINFEGGSLAAGSFVVAAGAPAHLGIGFIRCFVANDPSYASFAGTFYVSSNVTLTSLVTHFARIELRHGARLLVASASSVATNAVRIGALTLSPGATAVLASHGATVEVGGAYVRAGASLAINCASVTGDVPFRTDPALWTPTPQVTRSGVVVVDGALWLGNHTDSPFEARVVSVARGVVVDGDGHTHLVRVQLCVGATLASAGLTLVARSKTDLPTRILSESSDVGTLVLGRADRPGLVFGSTLVFGPEAGSTLLLHNPQSRPGATIHQTLVPEDDFFVVLNYSASVALTAARSFGDFVIVKDDSASKLHVTLLGTIGTAPGPGDSEPFRLRVSNSNAAEVTTVSTPADGSPFTISESATVEFGAATDEDGKQEGGVTVTAGARFAGPGTLSLWACRVRANASLDVATVLGPPATRVLEVDAPISFGRVQRWGGILRAHGPGEVLFRAADRSGLPSAASVMLASASLQTDQQASVAGHLFSNATGTQGTRLLVTVTSNLTVYGDPTVHAALWGDLAPITVALPTATLTVSGFVLSAAYQTRIDGPGRLVLGDGTRLIAPVTLAVGQLIGPPQGATLVLLGNATVAFASLLWGGTVRLGSPDTSLWLAGSCAPDRTAALVSTGGTIRVTNATCALRGTVTLASPRARFELTGVTVRDALTVQTQFSEAGAGGLDGQASVVLTDVHVLNNNNNNNNNNNEEAASAGLVVTGAEYLAGLPSVNLTTTRVTIGDGALPSVFRCGAGTHWHTSGSSSGNANVQIAFNASLELACSVALSGFVASGPGSVALRDGALLYGPCDDPFRTVLGGVMIAPAANDTVRLVHGGASSSSSSSSSGGGGGGMYFAVLSGWAGAVRVVPNPSDVKSEPNVVRFGRARDVAPTARLSLRAPYTTVVWNSDAPTEPLRGRVEAVVPNTTVQLFGTVSGQAGQGISVSAPDALRTITLNGTLQAALPLVAAVDVDTVGGAGLCLLQHVRVAPGTVLPWNLTSGPVAGGIVTLVPPLLVPGWSGWAGTLALADAPGPGTGTDTGTAAAAAGARVSVATGTALVARGDKATLSTVRSTPTTSSPDDAASAAPVLFGASDDDTDGHGAIIVLGGQPDGTSTVLSFGNFVTLSRSAGAAAAAESVALRIVADARNNSNPRVRIAPTGTGFSADSAIRFDPAQTGSVLAFGAGVTAGPNLLVDLTSHHVRFEYNSTCDSGLSVASATSAARVLFDGGSTVRGPQTAQNFGDASVRAPAPNDPNGPLLVVGGALVVLPSLVVDDGSAGVRVVGPATTLQLRTPALAATARLELSGGGATLFLGVGPADAPVFLAGSIVSVDGDNAVVFNGGSVSDTAVQVASNRALLLNCTSRTGTGTGTTGASLRVTSATNPLRLNAHAYLGVGHNVTWRAAVTFVGADSTFDLTGPGSTLATGTQVRWQTGLNTSPTLRCGAGARVARDIDLSSAAGSGAVALGAGCRVSAPNLWGGSAFQGSVTGPTTSEAVATGGAPLEIVGDFNNAAFTIGQFFVGGGTVVVNGTGTSVTTSRLAVDGPHGGIALHGTGSSWTVTSSATILSTLSGTLSLVGAGSRFVGLRGSVWGHTLTLQSSAGAGNFSGLGTADRFVLTDGGRLVLNLHPSTFVEQLTIAPLAGTGGGTVQLVSGRLASTVSLSPGIVSAGPPASTPCNALVLYGGASLATLTDWQGCVTVLAGAVTVTDVAVVNASAPNATLYSPAAGSPGAGGFLAGTILLPTPTTTLTVAGAYPSVHAARTTVNGTGQLVLTPTDPLPTTVFVGDLLLYGLTAVVLPPAAPAGAVVALAGTARVLVQGVGRVHVPFYAASSGVALDLQDTTLAPPCAVTACAGAPCLAHSVRLLATNVSDGVTFHPSTLLIVRGRLVDGQDAPLLATSTVPVHPTATVTVWQLVVHVNAVLVFGRSDPHATTGGSVRVRNLLVVNRGARVTVAPHVITPLPGLPTPVPVNVSVASLRVLLDGGTDVAYGPTELSRVFVRVDPGNAPLNTTGTTHLEPTTASDPALDPASGSAYNNTLYLSGGAGLQLDGDDVRGAFPTLQAGPAAGALAVPVRRVYRITVATRADPAAWPALVSRVTFAGARPSLGYDATGLGPMSAGFVLRFATCVRANTTGGRELVAQSVTPLYGGVQVIVEPNLAGCDPRDAYQSCTSDPCVGYNAQIATTHTARCEPLQDAFVCHCNPGFAGALCQTDIDECASAPCRHGGTCVDRVNSFQCQCTPLWDGVTCEIDVNECATSNGGCLTGDDGDDGDAYRACVNAPGGWSCVAFLGPIVSPDNAARPALPGGSMTEANAAGSAGYGTSTPTKPLLLWSTDACTLQFNVTVQYTQRALTGEAGDGFRVWLVHRDNHTAVPCDAAASRAIPDGLDVTQDPVPWEITCLAPVWFDTSNHIEIRYTSANHDTAVMPNGTLVRSQQLFSYLPPEYIGGTLRRDNTTNPGAASLDAGQSNSPLRVVFGVRNVGPPQLTWTVAANDSATDVAELTRVPVNRVFFGVTTGTNPQPYRYECVPDQLLSTRDWLYCTTPDGAAGNSMRFTVRAGTQDAVRRSDDTITFPMKPKLDSISGCQPDAAVNPRGTFNCPTEGGVTLTIRGANLFGTALGADTSDNPSVRGAGLTVVIGAAEGLSSRMTCNRDVLVNSDGTVATCTLSEGSGRNLTVTVTSALATDFPSGLGFSPPIITRVIGCNSTVDDAPTLNAVDCQRMGGDLITVLGSSFGPDSAQVLVGSVLVQAVQHVPNFTHTRLTFRTPAGTGLLRTVAVLSGSEVRDTNASISYHQCRPGQHQDGLRCVPCDRWSHSTVPDAAHCVPCAAGFVPAAPPPPPSSYDNGEVVGASSCGECARGSYSSSNQSACSACDVGTAQRALGQDACVPCRAGSYMNGTGAVECALCPAGSVSRHGGATHCDLCTGIQSQMYDGRAECQRCTPGNFFTPHPTPGRDTPYGGSCRPCAPGIVCNETGIYGAGSTYVYYDGDRNDLVAVECQPGFCTQCPAPPDATTSATALLVGPYYNPRSLLPLVDGQVFSCCAVNRPDASVNPLCGACAPGFYGWGNSCVPCDGANVGVALALVLVLWFYVTLFYRLAQISRADTRIVLNFIMFVALYLQTRAGSVVGWLSLFRFDVFQTSGTTCVAPLGPLAHLATGLFVPLLGACLLMFNTFLHWLLWLCLRRPDSCTHDVCPNDYATRRGGIRKMFAELRLQSTFWPVWNTYRRTLLAYVCSSYPSLAQSVFMFFNCIDANGDTYLQPYPAVSCTSDPTYTRLRPWFIVLLIAVAALPVVLFARLWVLHSPARRCALFNDKETRFVYGALTEAYRPALYFWESYVLVRRLLAAAVAQTVSPTDLRMKYTYLSCVNALFVFFHILRPPYSSVWDNAAELVSLVTLTILTVHLVDAPQPLDASRAAGLSAMCFVVGLALAGRIVFNRYEKYLAPDRAERGATTKAVAAALAIASHRRSVAADGTTKRRARKPLSSDALAVKRRELTTDSITGVEGGGSGGGSGGGGGGDAVASSPPQHPATGASSSPTVTAASAPGSPPSACAGAGAIGSGGASNTTALVSGAASPSSSPPRDAVAVAAAAAAPAERQPTSSPSAAADADGDVELAPLSSRR